MLLKTMAKRSADVSNSTKTSDGKSSIDLPPHWFLKLSRSRKGRIYYANKVKEIVSWEFPVFSPCPGKCKQCITYQQTYEEVEHNSEDPVQIKREDVIPASSTELYDKPSEQEQSVVQRLPRLQCKKFKISQKPKFIHTMKSLDCHGSITGNSKCIALKIDDELDTLDQKVMPKEISNVAGSSRVKGNSNVNIKKLNTGDNVQIKILRAHRRKLSLSHPRTKKSPPTRLQIPAKEEYAEVCDKLSKEKEANNYCDPSEDRNTNCGKEITNISPSPHRILKNGSVSKWDQTPRNIANKVRVSYITGTTSSSDEKSQVVQPIEDSTDADLPKNYKAPPISNQPCKRNITECDPPDTLNNYLAHSKTSNLDDNYSAKKFKSEQIPSKPVPNVECSSHDTSSKVSRIPKTSECLNKTSSSDFKENTQKDEPCDLAHSDFDTAEPMDTEIATELQNIRRTNSDQSIDNNAYSLSHLDNIASASSERNYTYIVVDTNVLISKLSLVQDISSCALYEGRVCVVVIPYTALQELDGLKGRATVESKARAAIRWCNERFVSDAGVVDSKVRGQSYYNYRSLQGTMGGTTGDDRIRDCCLYLQGQGLPTVLLSDDVNLRNKALMASVAAVDSSDLDRSIRAGSAAPSSRQGNKDQNDKDNVIKYAKSTLKKSPKNRRRRQQESDGGSHCNNNLSLKIESPTKQTFKAKRRKCRSLGSPRGNKKLGWSRDQNFRRDDEQCNNSLRSSTVEFTRSDDIVERDSVMNVGGKVSSSSMLTLVSETGESTTLQENKKSSDHWTSLKESAIISLEKTLGNVLEYVMNKDFGDLWVMIVKHKPPWTLKNILDNWHKHWIASFMDKFPAKLKNQLKTIEPLCCNNRRSNINECELKRKTIELFKHFSKPPYKDLIEYPVEQKCEQVTEIEDLRKCRGDFIHPANPVSVCEEVEERDYRSPAAVHVSDHQQMQQQHVLQPMAYQAAKDVIVSTGNRMREIVSEGVSCVSTEPCQPALLSSLSMLQCCVHRLAEAIIRCQGSGDQASVEHLCDAVLGFWTNANSGEQEQQFVRSAPGQRELMAYVASSESKEFMARCLEELHKMAAQLDNCLCRWRMDTNTL